VREAQAMRPSKDLSDVGAGRSGVGRRFFSNCWASRAPRSHIALARFPRDDLRSQSMVREPHDDDYSWSRDVDRTLIGRCMLRDARVSSYA